jgi:alpha-methylacyl-CoA racemase
MDMDNRQNVGPLAGISVLEFPALGPVPFAAMMLADLGANVVRIDRCEAVNTPCQDALEAVQSGLDTLARSRKRIALDLKDPEAIAIIRALATKADVLLEGFRPGVAERLGLGPDELMTENPQLIYTRVTGWGQDGPLARTAGHEINYLALAGALAASNSGASGPVPPVGYLGDLAGGGMLAVIGALAALAERQRSGLGQVIDASIVDATLLTGSIDRFLRTRDAWGPPGTNALDGGSHFYRCYLTADDRWISFGALEPKFHDAMLRGLDIDPDEVDQFDQSAWPALSERAQAVVETATMQEWIERFEGTDACFAPVLTHEEAATHPQLVARSSLTGPDAGLEPAPAPRLSRTPAPPPGEVAPPGAHTVPILQSVGLAADKIDALLQRGAARHATQAD